MKLSKFFWHSIFSIDEFSILEEGLKIHKIRLFFVCIFLGIQDALTHKIWPSNELSCFLCVTTRNLREYVKRLDHSNKKYFENICK